MLRSLIIFALFVNGWAQTCDPNLNRVCPYLKWPVYGDCETHSCENDGDVSNAKRTSVCPFKDVSQISTSLWSRTAKNTDCSTGPLARPFARSLAPLTRSLAPACSLRSRPPLRSLLRSLAHFAHSLARGKVNF